MTDNNTRQSLGIDIGGTGIKVAVVDTAVGRLLTSPIYRPTQPSTPSAIASAIKQIVDELRWQGPIGCGYPGVVQNGIARTAVHLSKEWIDQDISRILGDAVGAPVAVINDADAAGIDGQVVDVPVPHLTIRYFGGFELGANVVLVVLGQARLLDDFVVIRIDVEVGEALVRESDEEFAVDLFDDDFGGDVLGRLGLLSQPDRACP